MYPHIASFDTVLGIKKKQKHKKNGRLKKPNES